MNNTTISADTEAQIQTMTDQSGSSNSESNTLLIILAVFVVVLIIAGVCMLSARRRS